MSTAIARDGYTGRISTLNSTPAQLTTDCSKIANEGVQLYAPSGNTDTLYVGYSSAITADSADATDGFPLPAGGGLFVPARRMCDIWIRTATGTGQKVFFIAQ